MNSKIITDKKDFKLYPYNYRMVEYVEIQPKNNIKEPNEGEKNKIKSLKILFYKPISRVQ